MKNKNNIIDDWLEENGGPEIEEQVKKEARQIMENSKQAGSTRSRLKEGLNLYALDNETGEIYEVQVQKREGERKTKKNGKGNFIIEGSHRADVNPNHKLIWALNLKNAYRKFANDTSNLPIMAKAGE